MIERIMDRICFGMLMLLPASIVMCMFVFIAGEYSGTIILLGTSITATCYFLGDMMIAMIGKEDSL